MSQPSLVNLPVRNCASEMATNGAAILVVNDEPKIRRALRRILYTAGYLVLEAKDGGGAIESIIRDRPDLVLLDLSMRDMSGLELCGRVRQSFEGPIIVLTVFSSMSVFNVGADDYVVKPFSTEELLARIEVALRRSNFGQRSARIRTADLMVDFERRIVEARGERIHLTPKEFEVLRMLVDHEGKAVPYRRILQIVWGPDYGGALQKIRGVIKGLRKKIEPEPGEPHYVITEPCFGYRFEVPRRSNGSRRNL